MGGWGNEENFSNYTVLYAYLIHYFAPPPTPTPCGYFLISVTICGDLLDIGQPFKAFSNN